MVKIIKVLTTLSIIPKSLLRKRKTVSEMKLLVMKILQSKPLEIAIPANSMSMLIDREKTQLKMPTQRMTLLHKDLGHWDRDILEVKPMVKLVPTLFKVVLKVQIA